MFRTEEAHIIYFHSLEKGKYTIKVCMSILLVPYLMKTSTPGTIIHSLLLVPIVLSFIGVYRAEKLLKSLIPLESTFYLLQPQL